MYLSTNRHTDKFILRCLKLEKKIFEDKRKTKKYLMYRIYHNEIENKLKEINKKINLKIYTL